MSDELTSSKKRPAAESVKRSSEDDHRRKRRNRTTQSCLNCHTSKRMCDRKRPCGRCTQLGLTGLCVYEVDDPSQRIDSQDEASRLQKRVAELESVIRELKNKPHPRWVQQPGGASVDDSDKRSSSSREPSTPAENSRPVTRNGAQGFSHSFNSAEIEDGDPSSMASTSSSRASSIPLTQTTSNLTSLISYRDSASSSSSTTSAFSSPSPNHPPSPSPLSPVSVTPAQSSQLPQGDYDIASLLSSCYTDPVGMEDNIFETIFDRLVRTDMGHANMPVIESGHNLMTRGDCQVEDHCGCLNDSLSYTVVLELSLRLRKAAETLQNSPKHTPGSNSNCQINQRIAELDRLTTNVLGSISIPPHSSSYSNHRPVARAIPNPSYHASMYGGPGPTSTSSVSTHPGNSLRAWDLHPPSSYPSPPGDDSFMSWEPPRRPADWNV